MRSSLDVAQQAGASNTNLYKTVLRNCRARLGDPRTIQGAAQRPNRLDYSIKKRLSEFAKRKTDKEKKDST